MMGFNTVAVLYNDFTGEFRREGRIGQRIADAMRDYHDEDHHSRNFAVLCSNLTQKR